MNKINKWAVAGMLLASTVLTRAEGPADPTTITTVATAAFGGVSALAVTCLSFWVVYRIIRRIKG